jgi:hypothetical protein
LVVVVVPEVVVVVVAGPAVVVVVGAVVVVVELVVACRTIWSVVVAVGALGVTPAGSKAIVRRRSFTNLTFAGFVVRVGFFWSKEVQYA